MKMIRFTVWFIAGFLLFFHCASPKNPPTNPSDANIIIDSSLKSVRDSIKAATVVQCTVSVFLPNLVDSFFVTLDKTGYDTTIASGKVTQDIVTFQLAPQSTGTFKLSVVIVKADGSRDSLVKDITVFVLAPIVGCDSLSFHAPLSADSFTFKFTVTDPDSNMRFAYILIDTAFGPTQTTSFLSLKPFKETVSRTIKGNTFKSALSAPLVCQAYALDADSLFSNIASCTLHVFDTTKPSITLLEPDTSATITSLPKRIKAIISDLAGIASATFNGSSMVFSHDTATYEASTIDSGKSIDSIVAFDKPGYKDSVGNKTVLRFGLTYSGKKSFPPKIKELTRATTEGRSFGSLFLDTCVVLTDTSIKDPVSFKKDSLSWIITDSTGGTIAVPGTHIVPLPFPTDTEWTGIFRLTFKVFSANSPALFDVKQPAFFVTEVYDPPRITVNGFICSTKPHSDTMYLDANTTVSAVDDKLSSLNWSFKNGKHFKVDSLYSSLRGLPKKAETQTGPIIVSGGISPIFGSYFNRHIVISPITVADSGYYGYDTLLFSVKSAQGADSKQIIFSHATNCHLIYIPGP